MYLLDGASDEAVAELRGALDGLGDCVSVVGDGAALWTVHVHCNDIGAAVEAGVRGRPSAPDHGRPVRRPDRRAGFPVRARPGDRGGPVSGAVDLFRAEGAVVFDLASTYCDAHGPVVGHRVDARASRRGAAG